MGPGPSIGRGGVDWRCALRKPRRQPPSLAAHEAAYCETMSAMMPVAMATSRRSPLSARTQW